MRREKLLFGTIDLNGARAGDPTEPKISYLFVTFYLVDITT